MSLSRHLLIHPAPADDDVRSMLIETQFVHPHRSVGYALGVISRRLGLARHGLDVAAEEAELQRHQPLGRITAKQLEQLAMAIHQPAQPINS